MEKETRKLPPRYVKYILNAIERAGFEARLAGGCVRDTLMGRRPADWDIACSAPPDAVEALFPRTVPTGKRHGTVTVLYGGGSCEVTTYRVEGAYSDRRRPDGVRFTSSLEADLARRDFTVNAMAMDAAGNLTDPFGGREDIERWLIRCVGSPEERFSEDALRMLRALRFAAKLGFEIDGPTLAAISDCAPLASALSAERVAAELAGILASPRPDFAWALAGLGLLDKYLLPGRDVSAAQSALARLPVYARTAHFCAALESGGNITSTESFLRALRFDARTAKTASAAAKILRSGSRDYKRLLRDYGEAAALAAYPKSRALREVLRSGECWSLRTLAVGGAELAALGYSGRELGAELESLLERVIERPELNKAEILCKLAEEDLDNDRA